MDLVEVLPFLKLGGVAIDLVIVRGYTFSYSHFLLITTSKHLMYVGYSATSPPEDNEVGRSGSGDVPRALGGSQVQTYDTQTLRSQLLVPQNPRDWFGSGPLLRRVQGRVWVKEILQVWEIYPSKLYPPDAPFSFTARLLVPNQNHGD